MSQVKTAPWNQTVRPVSFLEVMDEELAQKMQKEVEPSSRRAQSKNQTSTSISNNKKPVSIETNFRVGRSSRGRYSANDYVYFEEHEEYEEEPQYEQFVEESNEEELDEDLKLALQLSEQESKAAPQKGNDEDDELKKILELSAQEAKQSGIEITEPTSNNNSQPSEDEDFKLALKLQEELESEAAAQRMHERQVKQLQQHRNGGLVGYATEFMYDKTWQEDEEEYDDEEQDQLDDEEDVDLSSFTQAEKLHHYAAKYGGRVPRTQFNQAEEEEYEESEEMITKHDPVISGFMNAETLERIMDTGNLSGLRVPAPVFNRMREKVKTQKAHANRVRGHQIDKSTSEQVLDTRTRVLLLRLMNNDVIGDLDGIISSGKEANVYHAMSGHLDEEGNEVEPVPCAVKIYKTTLNEFKNRSEYIDGEFRFRHQTRQHNPMKLIKMWAEKETRNLKRLNSANIPSPVPVILRDNVLIMTFIGKNGFPAPRLKEVPELEGSKLKSIYEQCVKIMRTMYHQCHLVHADMSEYNLLYHKRQVHVIDVAQAVEWDHPNAMEFLKKDCTCMSNFFIKKGLSIAMSPRQLFDFVVDITLDDKDVDKYLAKMEQIKTESPDQHEDQEFEANERLFQQSFIPRTLDQVSSPVKELYDNEIAFHQSVHGLSPNILANDNDEDEEDEEDEDSGVDESWVVVEATQEL